ncbi:invasion associated locus B family protein [Rhizobiaceae bacterium n13]|uniref:Invasion associated locus B family protein n=1 Tax=Ferirhizobium litorale TaxID=2927786 RepID=A0AAE3QCA4_9HYPH|nr:invasion associated locus B family protein [Fererhizobium litorale]MDI7860573.1 invasion associated locus B family protein [Fererhizobium litorale]MDI7920721.1 invasion associated locus B family protein [Fererhizobium litorale]
MNKPTLTLSLFLLTVLPALAQPTMVKRVDDWGVYSYESGGKTTCYTLTVPLAQAPSNVDHGRNFFIVAPGGKKGYEPQARMGYSLKADSRVKVEIDDQTFWLFGKDDTAWVQQEERRPEMVRAMRAGRQMTVHATSRRGTETTYTYSLNGVTAALKQVGQCN